MRRFHFEDNTTMLTVTKQYRDFPAAHRQPNHDGHCRLIHGHNWGWDITFACEVLDANGFVVDVGKLKPIKERLTELFDHTLLLNASDPIVDEVFAGPLFSGRLATVVLVPNCGMEGLAKFVFEEANVVLARDFAADVEKRKLKVVSVTCWEDSKNSSTYSL